jgi:hypothetical protein
VPEGSRARFSCPVDGVDDARAIQTGAVANRSLHVPLLELTYTSCGSN